MRRASCSKSLLLSTGALVTLSACGGGSGSATGGTGRLSVRALWQQPYVEGASAEAAAEIARPQQDGFGPAISPAATTVRFLFASATGFRCCLAVDPMRVPVDPSSGRRVLVLDDLPPGPATLQLSAFATTFAPSAGANQTCGVDPSSLSQSCDPVRPATPSFDSEPLPLTVLAGAETNAGDILISAVPFVLDETVRPAPDSAEVNPVSIHTTVVDAATGVDPASISLSVTQDGVAPVGAPVTLQACDDISSAPCSRNGQLQVSGLQVVSEPILLQPGTADVRLTAANRAVPPKTVEFAYRFTVLPPTARPPVTEPPPPTETRTPTVTLTRTRTPPPLGSPTPAPTSTPMPAIVFVPAPARDVTPLPEFIAVADFNEDGRADVAVTSPNSKEVNVLLGAPDGSLAAGSVLHFEDTPGSLSAGDLNRDGIPDLAVVARRAGAVFIALGRGDGSFAAPVPRDAGRSPFAVAIADFDQRNGNDLVISDRSRNQVLILLNDGSPSPAFADGGTASVGSQPEQVLSADFNGDGAADIVTLNQGGTVTKTATLLIFDQLMLGRPVFRQPVNVVVGEGTLMLQLGELNRDALPDLAAVGQSSDGRGGGEVHFLLGRSDGLLTMGSPLRVSCPPPITTSRCRPLALQTGDFDADGNGDLAVAQSVSDPGGDALQLFAGTGDLSFAPQGSLRTEPSPRVIAVGDVTGDGAVDLIVASHGRSMLQVYVNASIMRP